MEEMLYRKGYGVYAIHPSSSSEFILDKESHTRIHNIKKKLLYIARFIERQIANDIGTSVILTGQPEGEKKVSRMP